MPKSTYLAEATLHSEKIKPVVLAVVKLCLAECISHTISQSLTNLKENCNDAMKVFKPL